MAKTLRATVVVLAVVIIGVAVGSFGGGYTAGYYRGFADGSDSIDPQKTGAAAEFFRGWDAAMRAQQEQAAQPAR